MKTYSTVSVMMAVHAQKPPPLKLASGLYPLSDRISYYTQATLQKIQLYDKVIARSLDETMLTTAIVAKVALKDNVSIYNYSDECHINSKLANVVLFDKVIRHQQPSDECHINSKLANVVLFDKVIRHQQPSDGYAIQAKVVHAILKNKIGNS